MNLLYLLLCLLVELVSLCNGEVNRENQEGDNGHFFSLSLNQTHQLELTFSILNGSVNSNHLFYFYDNTTTIYLDHRIFFYYECQLHNSTMKPTFERAYQLDNPEYENEKKRGNEKENKKINPFFTNEDLREEETNSNERKRTNFEAMGQVEEGGIVDMSELKKKKRVHKTLFKNGQLKYNENKPENMKQKRQERRKKALVEPHKTTTNQVSTTTSPRKRANEDRALKQLFYNDPLFSNQWHHELVNTLFAHKEMGITGKGVKISIPDDGVVYTHKDLKSGFDESNSYDYNYGRKDPSPMDPDYDRHGTRCAGEIAARGNNSVCGIGIAPDSKFAALKILASDGGGITDAHEAAALQMGFPNIDIFSNSWGPLDNGIASEQMGPLAESSLKNGALNGRNGLGTLYFWASGNGGNKDNCAFDGYASSEFAIAVSAMSRDGFAPYYAEYCPNALFVTPSSGAGFGIVTIDSTGSNECTDGHGGTSAAAPIAAGIAALALEKNKKLTRIELEFLLALSAQINLITRLYYLQNQQQQSQTTSGADKSQIIFSKETIRDFGVWIPGQQQQQQQQDYTYEMYTKGVWSANGNGFIHHPKMGFGLLDVKLLLILMEFFENYQNEKIRYDFESISVFLEQSGLPSKTKEDKFFLETVTRSLNGSCFEKTTTPEIFCQTPILKIRNRLNYKKALVKNGSNTFLLTSYSLQLNSISANQANGFKFLVNKDSISKAVLATVGNNNIKESDFGEFAANPVIMRISLTTTISFPAQPQYSSGRGGLVIKLKSPSGSIGFLTSKRSNDKNKSKLVKKFNTVQFLGEDLNEGEWFLYVDGGKVEQASIKFMFL